jgi:hypothetical protein
MILADNNYEGFSTPQLHIFQKRKKNSIFEGLFNDQIDPRVKGNK